jgi:Flp pilus assembly protein TadG
MRLKSSEDGAAAVEFVLVLPFLLVLFFGMVDFGLAYNAKVTLTHAAREGVRTLALKKDTELAKQHTKDAAVGVVNPANITFAPLTVCSTGSKATLTAHYTYEFVTPVGALMAALPGVTSSSGTGASVNLTSTGVMRCGG